MVKFTVIGIGYWLQLPLLVIVLSANVQLKGYR